MNKEAETIESLRIKNELLQQVIEKKAVEMAKLEREFIKLTDQIEELKDEMAYERM